MKKISFLAKGLLLLHVLTAGLASAQIPTSGLVGYWPFSGNANDLSGNGNNGTVNGATLTTDRFGNMNTAYFFNGSSSYIEVPHSTSLNVTGNVSFSVWMKIDVLPTDGKEHYFLSKHTGSGTTTNGFHLAVSDYSNQDNLWLRYMNANNVWGDVSISFSALPISTWFHLVFTKGSGFNRIYLNGALVASNAIASNAEIGQNTGSLLFGKDVGWNPSTDAFFNGHLDDIRIYTRELALCEIEQLYYENSPQPLNPLGTSGIICQGGSSTLTASGASTYTWAPSTGLSATNASTVTANPSSTTIYTVSGTTSAGCVFSRTVQLNVANNPGATLTTTNVTCNGGSNGAIDLTASGGSPNTSIQFDGVDDYVEIPTLTWTPTQYSIEWWHYPVTLSDYNQILTAVSGWGAFQFHSTANGAVYVGTDVATRMTPTDLPASTLALNQWQHFTFTFNNGTARFYKNGALLATKSGMTMPVGWNGFRISNTGLTTAINGKIDNFRVWNVELNAATVLNNYSNCNRIPSSHPNYLNLILEFLMNEASGTNTYNSVSSSYGGTFINGPTWATASSTNYACNTSGSGYTYLWNTTSTLEDISLLNAGSYSVTVTDGNGCSATASTTITEPPPVSLTFSPSAPSVCVGGSVSINVSGAASYTWSPATALSATVGASVSASPASNIVYTVNALDASSCAGTHTVAVTVNSLPTVSIAGANTICAGDNTTLGASGANTYTWNTTSTTASITVSPTSNTTYTVTGTDANGCQNTATHALTVNPLPSVSIAGTNAICAGDNTTLAASGANTYTWNTTATTASISVSPTSNATYSVTGTDANGCQNTATHTLTVNPLPLVSIAGVSAICAGDNATLGASGANTYTWNTTATTASISVSPTSSATYTVTGTDANGCQNTATHALTVNPLPTVSISGSGAICAGGNAILGALGANTYTWSTTATTASITVSPTSNTTYTVTGTDANGCQNTATHALAVNSLPSVSIAGTSAICAGDNATLAASGANTYTWNTTATTASITVSPTSNTTYTVTGTGTNGCQNTATHALTVNPLPSVSIAGTNTICAGDSTILGASGANTYTWSTAATTSSITVSPTSNATYTVTGTDANGCSNTAAATVTANAVPATPIITASVAVLSSSAASGNQWYLGGAPIAGATGQTYTMTANGTYMVCVTNSSGCQSCSQTYTMTSIGIREAWAQTAGLMIYPNPSNGEFTIKSETEEGITVINELGQCVKTIELKSSNHYAATVNGLAGGVYFIVGKAARYKVIVIE